MSRLKDMESVSLSTLRIRAQEFLDDPLWRAMRGEIEDDRDRIFTDLTDANTPAEKLKFAQGELAQANRDILLVESFLTALTRELERRQRAMERA